MKLLDYSRLFFLNTLPNLALILNKNLLKKINFKLCKYYYVIILLSTKNNFTDEFV